jgi:hypothetical protein
LHILIVENNKTLVRMLNEDRSSYGSARWLVEF